MLRLVRLVGLLSLTHRALRRWRTEDIAQAGLLFVLFQEFCLGRASRDKKWRHGVH